MNIFKIIKTIIRYLILFLIIISFLFMTRLIRPIESKTELNNSVCGKIKLEIYEINVRIKIPLIPKYPISLSEDFKQI
jgi:hypothetical protein